MKTTNSRDSRPALCPCGHTSADVNLLFFAPLHEQGNKQINELLDAFTAISGLEIYRTLVGLSDRMCQPLSGTTIAVLFASSTKTLTELVAIREMLLRTRIILVLPDHTAETVSRGHLIRPRFIAYCDTDTAEIIAVLQKMIGPPTVVAGAEAERHGDPGH